MRGVWTIAKREVHAYFVSAMAYVVLFVWLVLQGLTLYLYAEFFADGQSSPGVTQTPLTLFFGQSSLFYMALLVIVPIQLLAGTFFAGGGIIGFLAGVLTCSALSVGYLGALALFVRGAIRRRRADLLLSAPLLPVYWVMLGAAALRAVRQLGGARRAAWEKTEHGREPRRLGPGVRAASAIPRRLRRGFASG